jgi:hypothetical protein
MRGARTSTSTLKTKVGTNGLVAVEIVVAVSILVAASIVVAVEIVVAASIVVAVSMVIAASTVVAVDTPIVSVERLLCSTADLHIAHITMDSDQKKKSDTYTTKSGLGSGAGAHPVCPEIIAGWLVEGSFQENVVMWSDHLGIHGL